MITYEYPFNERIRTLLRLEDLFDKTAYFLQAEGSHEHHVALVTLFGNFTMQNMRVTVMVANSLLVWV